MEITWLGHNCWGIRTGGCKILLDPFLDESPTAPMKAEDVATDYILISHGHFDHVADAVSIAKRCGAKVLCNFEIGEWLKAQGVASENVVQMNLGGKSVQSFGSVKMTLAHHSSQLPDGSNGGNPGGFLLEAEQKRIYFACDTGLFLDMKLIGAGGIDLAVLPIGDLFTMGPDDSVEATNLLNARRVLPCHYNTWPPIEQDPDAWAEMIQRHTAAEPMVRDPGETIEI